MSSCVRAIRHEDVFILVPCHRRDCLDCFTRLRTEQLEILLQHFNAKPIYMLERENWDYLRKVVKRAGHNALTVPREDQPALIFTDHPFEHAVLVEDVEATLLPALLATPVGTSISPTDGWTLSVHPRARTIKEDNDAYEPSGGHSHFRYSKPWKEIAAAAHKLHLPLERITDDLGKYQRWRISGLEELGLFEYMEWQHLTGEYEIIPRHILEQVA